MHGHAGNREEKGRVKKERDEKAAGTHVLRGNLKVSDGEDVVRQGLVHNPLDHPQHHVGCHQRPDQNTKSPVVLWEESAMVR